MRIGIVEKKRNPLTAKPARTTDYRSKILTFS